MVDLRVGLQFRRFFGSQACCAILVQQLLQACLCAGRQLESQYLLRCCTAREELAFWSRWNGGSLDSAEGAAAALELGPLLDLEVRRLSAGQRRRLALARLLAAPRPLWLLDEPLSPLDAGWRARFGAMMRTHLAGGGLILAAVHDPLPIPARSLELSA